MGDGLARVLSKQDFNAEAFVTKQTSNSNLSNIEELLDLRKQVNQLRDETSVNLKKNVYKHYSQFIETAKEISILEGEMYQLSHLLTDQKNLMTNLMELSITGSKADSELENDKAQQVEEFETKISLSYLLDKVEGCGSITEVADRQLLFDGDLIEVDVDLLSQIQKVHLFLLNDSLMITTWLPERKGQEHFKYQTLYELDGLAIVNVKDAGNVKNSFKVLMFPDARLFTAPSPKVKRQWLDLLEEAKQKKTQSKAANNATAATTAGSCSRGNGSQATASSSLSSAVTAGGRYSRQQGAPNRPMNGLDSKNVPQDVEMLRVDWVMELPEDLDVCIAQRDFEGAVDMITRINEYLEPLPKTASICDYKNRIEHRTKQLCDLLTYELVVIPESSIKCGQGSLRRIVTQLIRLHKSCLACELFLKNRHAACQHHLKMLKNESVTSLYVTGLCRLFFNWLVETSKEFCLVFQKHPGCFSAFILWCRDELESFVALFSAQVFATKSNFSAVASCVAEARKCCKMLSESGFDMLFVLDNMLSCNLLLLMQQAGDTQMDAIRHRATDDQWRPLNYQTKTSLLKFEQDMVNLGFANIKDFSYDECFTMLTANTIQFTRSYVQFSTDILNMYIPTLKVAIDDGLVDILNAQVTHLINSFKSSKFSDAQQCIKMNAQFLSGSLIVWLNEKYGDVVRGPFLKLGELKEKLDQVVNVDVSVRL